MIKTIAFLGAGGTQISPIEYAKNKGYKVITFDNIPSNPGHVLSDISYNISITEYDLIEEKCKIHKVDAIIGYASDLAVIAQAHISERLNLIGPSVKNIKLFTHKNDFRKFMLSENLQNIFFKEYSLTDLELIAKDIASFPASKYILKPVDSAGSKGVYIFDQNEFDINKAKESFSFSIEGKIIIEQFIDKKKPQVCGDGFANEGKLVFVDYGDGHFHDFIQSPVPYGETFPGTHDQKIYTKISSYLESIISKTNYSGPLNFDVFVSQDDSIFINEIGPRSGGNFIPDIIGIKNRFDFVGAIVEYFLGNKVYFPIVNNNSFTASYMLHSLEGFTYKGITLKSELKQYLIKQSIFKNEGSKVNPFISGNHSFGNLTFKFPDKVTMLDSFSNINKLIHFT